MNEQDLTRRLGLLIETPVRPPAELVEILWLELEPELSEPKAGTVEEPSGEADTMSVDDDPSSNRLGLHGPMRAAAVFLLVVGVGAVALWLRQDDTPDRSVDTTTTPASTTPPEGSDPPGQALVGADGAITLPEGYFPTAMADAGEGLIVAVADREPRVDDTPPQARGTVLLIDRTDGEIIWQRDLEGGPSLTETTGDAVWVAHYWTGTVTKLDLRSGELLSTETIELPFDVGTGPDRRHFIPNDLEVSFGSLWVSTARGAVAEIDLGSGQVVTVTPLTSEGVPVLVSGIEASDHDLWVAAETAGVVVLNPEDHAISSIPVSSLDHGASFLTFHDGIVFVGGFIGSGAPRVTGLDQVARDSYGSSEVPGSSSLLLEVGGQLLVFDGEDRLWPIDPNSVTLGSPAGLPRSLSGEIADSGETLWVVDPVGRSLHPFSLEDLLGETVTTTPGSDAPVVAWRHVGVGMDNSTLATSGRIVLADRERVYVADGFGGPDGGATLAALSAQTGEVIWMMKDLVNQPGNVFLQTLFDGTLVVNDQFDTVWTVDAATGEVRWTFMMISGYGAVGSVVAGETLVLAVDAQTEGDTRPPMVYGLDLADATVRWQTRLTEGTDLQWHSPALGDGVVVVSSTLSHPGSAPGNMIHAIDVGTGAIRWTADLGGEQGFHHAPTLIDGETVFVRGPEGVVALDLSDGSELWRSPGLGPWPSGLWPLAILPTGELLAADGSPYGGEAGDLVLLDPETGNPSLLVSADPAVGFPVGDVFVIDGTIVLATRSGLRGLDLNGSVLWSWNALSSVVDLVAIVDGLVAVPTADRSVVTVRLP